MDTRTFKTWLEQATQLTAAQRRKTAAWLAERAARPERPASSPGGGDVEALAQALGTCEACPWCGAGDPHPWGFRQGLQRWRCKACSRTFNVLTGTPLARLKRKEAWLPYAACLRESLSVHQSAGHCGLDPKTAFRWRHRFLAGLERDQARSLGARGPAGGPGIVEADETFFKESFKGQRHLPRPARLRGGPAPARFRVWVRAVTIRDRQGATREWVTLRFRTMELIAELALDLHPEAILCTDGHAAYRRLARALGLRHEVLNARAGEHARGPYHLQGVNAWHRRLKEWIARFHGVATKYLAHYLGWNRLLDGRKGSIPQDRLIQAALGRYRFQP